MVGPIKDGDTRWTRGMDSASDPKTMPPESYAFAVNMLNRGGVLQTRPGFRRMFTLPAGKLQGLTVFQPNLGLPVLLAIVGGIPYVSRYPFTSYSTVPGDRMSESADKVYSEQAVQAAERNPDNSLRLIKPRRLLILQDGINPAAHYDGRALTAIRGPNVTPQGTHMKFVSGRLWVARRNQLFASDIANPLSFVEQTFNTLGGISYYILPGRATGLATTPGVQLPQLLAFTDSTTTSFRTDVLERELWSQIEFQRTIFPNVGCKSARSIRAHNNLLWWWSNYGLTNFDAAAITQTTSRTLFVDTKMTVSGHALNEDLSGVCAASYENFFLVSVPHASKRNRHTWVYDETPLVEENAPGCWAGVWTGINPVEWVSVELPGKTRLFCASVDDDGNNRVYEAFTSDRRDNGCDFPWLVETRGYTGNSLVKKYFRFAEFHLSELSGQTDLRVSWAGSQRGRWKKCGLPVFKSREGNISAARTYSATDILFGLKRQSRMARTEDIEAKPEEDSLSSSGIEGNVYAEDRGKEALDVDFQLRFEGSGPCSIRAVRLFLDPEAEPATGMPDVADEDNHYVRFDGAASDSEEPLTEPQETFNGSANAVARYGNFQAQASASVTSTISQSDADKRAAQVAAARAETRLAAIAPPYEKVQSL